MSVRNLERVFKPASVALIGASNTAGSLGSVLADNLIAGGFKGPILPVTNEDWAVRGVMTYSAVDELPVAPDLAIITTPPETAPALIDLLGRRGTRGAVVISPGFADLGDEGKALQQQMLDAAKPHLLRIVGPNCMGIVVPEHGLNASFIHRTPLPGSLAFISQSGAVMSTVVDWATYRGVGFSHLVSAGDMADVDFGDLLDYWLADPRTRAILLHMEGLKDARKFMSAARAASRTKPVVVIKTGRSAEGAQAAETHTGTMAGEDDVYAAAFRRAGMLRVGNLSEVFAAVETLGMGLRVKGDRLAILSNGGGMGVLATDELVGRGGQMARLSDETRSSLDELLPRFCSMTNPVDIAADADPERYRKALALLLADDTLDAVLVLNSPTAVNRLDKCADAVIEAVKERRRPTLTCWLGKEGPRAARKRFADAKIPTYDTPEDAIQGFMNLVAHQQNQDLLLQAPMSIDVAARTDVVSARQHCRDALDAGRDWLTEPESKRLLHAYSIPTVRTQTAVTPEQAGKLGARMGMRVALKILSPDIPHKSDVDGVKLGLEGADEIRSAAEAMLRRVQEHAPEARIEGFSVQEMVAMPDSHELIIGAKTDPLFGPVILFGAGGIAAEALRDRAVALPPLNMELAQEMIAKTRVFRLLQGYRNRPGAAIDQIALALVRLGQLMADVDLIDAVDVNPLLANSNGVLALDARIKLAEPDRTGTQRLAIRPYPRELEKLVTIRDGTPVHLRPIRPDDAAAVQDMIARSNLEDLRMRFFTAMKQLPPSLAARLTQIDYDREMAFVGYADNGQNDGLWGVGRLHCEPDRQRAEYAVMTRSDVAGRGLGLRLMQEIIEHGQRLGVKEIFGEVLAENDRMLKMNERLGFVRNRTDDPEVVHVTLALSEH
ncbi:MAG: bifunctional acetate--CoA ligase family protein/GNAT family N-acetyltransferase [Pseudomonadota bacterium]